MKNIDEEVLRRMYDNKSTLVDIAEHFNVAILTIIRRIKKLGLSREKILFIEDIAGERFAELVAIRFDRLDRFGKAMWLVKCDCGREKVINASAMKAGLTTSCGCRKQRLARKGVEDISQAYWRKLEKSALQRDLYFSITKQQAWNLFVKQNKKCALSGVEITLYPNWDKYRLQTGSLDRKDSSKGYSIDNIQWVHKRVNFLKRDYSEEELIYWCTKIAKKNKDKFVDITNNIPIERRKLNENIQNKQAG